MAGLGMMLGAMVIVLLAVTNPGLSSVALWVIAAIAFAFGAWISVGGTRVRVSAARPQETAGAPATRRAGWLLAICLLPVLGVAIWGVASLPSHPHTSVVAVSSAPTLALFAVYLFARATRLASRLRFGALEGSSVFLAIAIVSLLNTLLLLTLDLPG